MGAAEFSQYGGNTGSHAISCDLPEVDGRGQHGLQLSAGSTGCTPGQTTIPVKGSVSIPCGLQVLDTGSFVFSPYYNALQYNFRVDLYPTENNRIYFSYYNVSFDQQQASPRQGLGALDIMRNRYGHADYTHTSARIS